MKGSSTLSFFYPLVSIRGLIYSMPIINNDDFDSGSLHQSVCSVGRIQEDSLSSCRYDRGKAAPLYILTESLQFEDIVLVDLNCWGILLRIFIL